MNLRAPLPVVVLAACLGVVAASPVHGQGEPTVYVAFGDSITDGVGDDAEEQPRGYPIRLENLLQNAGLDAEVRNRGLGAERTPEGLTRLPEVLDAEPDADVLLLMEGSNDISREISIETTRLNLAEMARRAEARGLEVVDATVIPRIPRARIDSDNLLNQQLNQQIRDLAGTQGRRLADNFQVFGSIEDVFARFYQDVPTDFVGHPNAEGYDIMADIFFDVLTGVDSVPPVPGVLDPRNGDRGLPASTQIRVDVWDFGEGIDLASTSLLIDGEEVAAQTQGGSRGATLLFQPATPFTGVVTVALRSRDLATPPNVFDREIASFVVAGTTFLDGDLDQNGRVDGLDLIDLARRFGALRGGSRYLGRADFDDDGVIDGTDLAVLAANFGQSSF